jgi:hypothetical protein
MVEQEFIRTGRHEEFWSLPVDRYVEVLRAVFVARWNTSANRNPPALNRVSVSTPSGPCHIRCCSHSGMDMDHDEVLLYLFHKSGAAPGTAGAIDVGPHRYVVPTPQAVMSTSFSLPPNWASWPVHLEYTEDEEKAWKSRQVEWAGDEPDCVCNSRTLATTGHEEGCRWIKWKRSRK